MTKKMLLLKIDGKLKDHFFELRELFSSDQEMLECLIKKILKKPPKNLTANKKFSFTKLVRLDRETHDDIKSLSKKLGASIVELVERELKKEE